MNSKKEKTKQIEMKAQASKKSWPIVKLGEMATLMTGGTPSTSKKEYYGGNIRWLVSSDIHKKEIFNCNGRITELGLKDSNAKILPTNSVLIALNGQGKTRGTVAMLRVAATCNQSLVSINPNKEKLLSEFLMYTLESKYEEIRRFSGGKDRGGLNMPTIRAIAIPLPPLDEQRNIATVLSQIQQNITVKDQLIKTTKELKKSVMNHFFTYGVKGEKTKHTEIGQIPKSWKVSKFKNSIQKISINRYNQIPKNDYLKNGEYPIIDQGKDFISGWTNNKSTLFNEKLPIIVFGDHTRIFKYLEKPFALGADGTKLICPVDSYDTNFFYYSLVNKKIPNKGYNRHYSLLKEVSLPLPSLEEQKKIAGILQKIDERIKNYEEQKASLEDLFKSMLHKLMTAQIRLHNIKNINTEIVRKVELQ